MRTILDPNLKDTRRGAIAEEALRACVHCGMCNATCPTYQLTGDEMEGPRGRIYLMKQVLEGAAPSRLTQEHLDSCLSCRACETTCPSGVSYHRLFDIGQEAVVAAVPRPLFERLLREAIRRVTISPALFSHLASLARTFRPLLPGALRGKIPAAVPVGLRPAQRHARTMLMLTGCVQSAIAGHFNATTARIFDRVGISLIEVREAGCCGAVSAHLDARDAARTQARKNLDAWGTFLDQDVEALIVNSSGCATFLRDYPDLLGDDPHYLPRAQRLAGLVRDPLEVLETLALVPIRAPRQARIAVHEPCTLQHGLKLTGRIAQLLARLGYDPQPVADNHLCCGSAGSYSLLQPKMAGRLKKAKLKALNASAPDIIFTGNIGCWMHLSDDAPVPVRHWLEAVDAVTAP